MFGYSKNGKEQFGHFSKMRQENSAYRYDHNSCSYEKCKKLCENYANKKTPLARVGLNH
jgi:hypothetical protein